MGNRTLPAGLRSSALVIAIVSALVASGCRESSAPTAEQPEDPSSRTFAYTGGGGSSARVTGAATLQGGERLRGETVLALGAHARRCILEDVTLDARGLLVRAEITVAPGCDQPADQRLILDAASGEVRATTAQGTVSRQVPSDAPWIYAPPSSTSTPVSAWVTAKATASAKAVRQVEAGRAQAALVPREQLAIETERGLTVIVGNDGADLDAAFVEQVRVAGYGVTLVRVAGSGRS